MLGYAKLCYSYAQLCSIMLHIMPIMLNYANYALCSDSAIMPKSNAGIIGLAQFGDQYNANGLYLSDSDGCPLFSRIPGACHVIVVCASACLCAVCGSF